MAISGRRPTPAASASRTTSPRRWPRTRCSGPGSRAGSAASPGRVRGLQRRRARRWPAARASSSSSRPSVWASPRRRDRRAPTRSHGAGELCAAFPKGQGAGRAPASLGAWFYGGRGVWVRVRRVQGFAAPASPPLTSALWPTRRARWPSRRSISGHGRLANAGLGEAIAAFGIRVWAGFERRVASGPASREGDGAWATTLACSSAGRTGTGSVCTDPPVLVRRCTRFSVRPPCATEGTSRAAKPAQRTLDIPGGEPTPPDHHRNRSRRSRGPNRAFGLCHARTVLPGCAECGPDVSAQAGDEAGGRESPLAVRGERVPGGVGDAAGEGDGVRSQR